MFDRNSSTDFLSAASASSGGRRYRHIFFDLDHTIWDFDKNAEEALLELYAIFGLQALGLRSAELFIDTYRRHNHRLWEEYHRGRITKDELREKRFRQTFLDLGVSPELVPEGFEEAYLQLCPTKKNVFPDAHETLQYLQSRYTLHLISNGFRESTEIKIAGAGLGKYFTQVIIAETVGMNKPDQAIFRHALELASAAKEESLMVGDSLEADVYGALNFGMDAIHFNPGNLPKPDDVPFQITRLKSLTSLL